jgi:hypothetical protein
LHIYYIYHTEAVESHIYGMHVNINRDIIPQPQPEICVSAY